MDERKTDTDLVTYADCEEFPDLEQILITDLINKGVDPGERTCGLDARVLVCHTRVLVLMMRAYLRSLHVCTCAAKDEKATALQAGYPIIKPDDKMPASDEKYDVKDAPYKSKNTLNGPQAKMPFLNSASVDKACLALKESNDYPCKMMITYKGRRRPWTNIPQVLHKFVIRYARTCVHIECVLA